MKRKTSTNLIVAILAIVMIFGLVGFGINQVNGDGIAVTVNDDNIKIKSLEAKIVFFAKDTTDAGNTDGSIDADTNDAAQGEDVNPEDAKDEEKANDDTEPVEIPKDIELKYKNGVIEINDDQKGEIFDALESYDGYLQVTAEAEGCYKYYNFDDKNIKGTPVNSLIIAGENGEAKFDTLKISFEKIPTAKITFISSDSDNNGLTARDGSSVTSVIVNGKAIKLNEEKVNDQLVKLSIPGSVQKTDKISFELVEGFKIASVNVGEEKYDSLAAALNSIKEDKDIVVKVEKTDTVGPDFDVEILTNSWDYKSIKITIKSDESNVKVEVTDDSNKSVTITQPNKNENVYTTSNISPKEFNKRSYTVTVTDAANNGEKKNVANHLEVSYEKSFITLETADNSDPKPAEQAEIKVTTSNLNTNNRYRLQLMQLKGDQAKLISTREFVKNDYEYTFTVSSKDYESNSYKVILIKIANATKNIASADLEIDFDRTHPEVQLNALKDGSDYYSKTLTVGVNESDIIYASDSSGIYKLHYVATAENLKVKVEVPDGEGTIEKEVPETYEGYVNVFNGEKSKNIFEDLNGCDDRWTVEVTAIDNAGNETPVTYTICYDTTAPVIDNVVFKPASGAQNGSHFSTTRTAEIKVSDTNPWEGTVTYTKDGKEQEPVTISSDGTAKIEFADDGVYEITKITVTDKAGNTTVAENDANKLGGEFTIDTTAPVIDNVVFTSASDAQNDSYYNKSRTAEIKVSDTNLSGGTVTYTKDGETQNPVTISNGTARIEFVDDGVYEITNITVTDKAGNTTVAENDANKLGGEFTIDTTAPVIDNVVFTSASDAQNDSYYNKSRTAEIKVSDTNLSGGTVTYTKDGEEQEEVKISSNGTAKIEFPDDGVYEITNITVTDMAGNTTVAENDANKLGGEFTIDTTAPVIDNVVFTSASDAQNDSYYNKSRTAEIKVSDTNLSGGTVTYTKDFTANADPAPEEIIATFTADENGNITLTMPEGCEETSDAGKITFNKDSIYRITKITVTDMAGNTTVAENDANKLGGEFTIDTTDPGVKVEYSEKSGPANGKYFNVIRTATITVTEHNFDKEIRIYGNSELDKEAFSKAKTSGVHVKIVPVAGDPESDANIKPFAFPTDKNAWKDEGDKHTLTVTYDSNAAYLFEVCVIDMAGNDDKRGLGSPDSNDTDFDFSVDKDIVPPQITGVNNGAAYSGDCVPVITFTDANYASSEVHIFRTRDGQINRDVTAQFGTGLAQNETGGVMTLNRFEKIPENDGIYTIVANMTDMAGNQSEARVTFSINRFGSVYKLGESLADLRGQHVQKIDKDLTITEINPDHLINGSLKVSITRNGKPIETMFSVKPGANNPTIGASGWFEYVYTISASNFKDDGFYTITVSSTDEAGNNSSTSSFEECRMEFWVDSTKSEFTSLIGLEKAIINADKAPVSITVYDEIGIKNITVYCDGVVIAKFEGDDINDINNFEGKFEVPSGRNQVVRIVIEDLSGNITDTEQLIEDGTLPEFMENIQNITVSTNFFVRWFANKLVFFGSIVGVIALGTAAWWFIIGKKRKEVGKEQTTAE